MVLIFAATRNPSSQINMELPPPSMFQSTKFKPDARKELAKVTSEILQLKEENQRLKFTFVFFCIFMNHYYCLIFINTQI